MRNMLNTPDKALYSVAQDIPLAGEMVVERGGPSSSREPIHLVHKDGDDDVNPKEDPEEDLLAEDDEGFDQ